MNTCANVQNNFFKSELYAKNNFSKSDFRVINSFLKSYWLHCFLQHGVYIRLAKGILRCQGECFWCDKVDFLPPLSAFVYRLAIFVRYMV